MKSLKKIIASIFSFNLIFISLWSMPGFESYFPDASGEYVYYQDNTFLRESYLGILYYNESTLQVRYYSPADTKKKLPENDISILFSINPDSPHWEMTGERILSTITPNSDDVTIVNYLHDMLYEFSAHRILVNNLNDRDIEIPQEFPQFGGNVLINYDCTIPIFNIKEIKSLDGQTKLKICTTGRLIDNSDHSFDEFKGFPIETYKKGRKHYKKSEPVEYVFNNQSILLDERWQNPMDNFWTLDNDSIISMGTLPPVNKDKKIAENFLLRKMIQSTESSFVNFDTLEIDSTNKGITIKSEIYQPNTGKTVINYKFLTYKDDSDYIDFFSIATFKQPWLDNIKYYEEIIESYTN